MIIKEIRCLALVAFLALASMAGNVAMGELPLGGASEDDEITAQEALQAVRRHRPKDIEVRSRWREYLKPHFERAEQFDLKSNHLLTRVGRLVLVAKNQSEDLEPEVQKLAIEIVEHFAINFQDSATQGDYMTMEAVLTGRFFDEEHVSVSTIRNAHAILSNPKIVEEIRQRGARGHDSHHHGFCLMLRVNTYTEEVPSDEIIGEAKRTTRNAEIFESGMRNKVVAAQIKDGTLKTIGGIERTLEDYKIDQVALNSPNKEMLENAKEDPDSRAVVLAGIREVHIVGRIRSGELTSIEEIRSFVELEKFEFLVSEELIEEARENLTNCLIFLKGMKGKTIAKRIRSGELETIQQIQKVLPPSNDN